MVAEWIILAILLTLAAAASTERKRAINATAQDDIDDFVPYQGERFNIFDWNIFQASFSKILDIVITAYTKGSFDF